MRLFRVSRGPCHRQLPTLCAAIALSALAISPPSRADTPNIAALLQKADDLTRGTSSRGKVTMHVKTARWERSLSMEMWSEGTEKTLIKILSPAKEKGTATLKVDKNIWNYLPKVDRTIKVPASMMSGSWMGSHFSNDDLVKESRFVDDYDCTFQQLPKDKTGTFVIACIPKSNAAVVWGKVVVTIRASDELIERTDYVDEKGKLIRTLTFSDVRDLGGRRIPARMKLTVIDKPDEFTEIVYDELELDIKVPAQMFTLQALKR